MSQAVEPMGEHGIPLSEAEGWWARRAVLPRAVYWGIHAACLLGFFITPSAGDLALCFGLVFGRVFFITAGYHRYFAHKTYKTSRAFQFVLAFCGASAVQKGPLWWASTHRQHHKYTDQTGIDPHTPKDGLYYSHQGWIFDGRWDGSNLDRIRDFARYPELVWLNRWHVVPPILLAVTCFLIGGWSALLWGFAVSTVLLWHLTYSINSIAHLWGTRRYDTPDTSRNNALLGLLALGEGWHNNHHHYCASARNGFFWWEVDITYYVLRTLAAVGLVWDLRQVPAHVKHPHPRKAPLDRAA